MVNRSPSFSRPSQVKVSPRVASQAAFHSGASLLQSLSRIAERPAITARAVAVNGPWGSQSFTVA